MRKGGARRSEARPRPGRHFLIFALALFSSTTLGVPNLGAEGSLPAGNSRLIPADLPPGRSILLRGPEPRRGLPFFSPNAIPVLVGEYAVRDSVVRVFSTRSPIVFSFSWKVLTLKLPRGERAYRLSREEGAVLALAAPGYTLFFSPPAALDSSILVDFALAFERRFLLFFGEAPTDAELSFPAWIDSSPSG